MGDYTGLRFIGTVKKEYRDSIKSIAMKGNWNESKVDIFRQFGDICRASFIPCGAVCYMPDDWDNDRRFDNSYDEKTGKWCFCCSLKNYNYTIENFFDTLPAFIEDVEYCEKYFEYARYSEKYELIDNKMVCINNNFIQYNNY